MQRTQAIERWLQSQWLKRGFWAWTFLPLSFITLAVVSLRRWLYRTGVLHETSIGVPVIVVGNLYVGGTGKTPLSCELANLLKTAGFRPGLISRGYGSAPKSVPATGQGQGLDWRIFGDEPVLIAQRTGVPISVHPNRVQAAKALLKFDPHIDLILSDDGLQHYALARDLELLVEDSRGAGNGFLLPAGPLREPAGRQQSVDAIFLRDPQQPTQPFSVPPKLGFKVEISGFYCPFNDQSMTPESMAKKVAAELDTLALAGIGIPERFFRSLSQSDIHVTKTLGLADHAPLAFGELQRLQATTILMTEKDAVKCAEQLDARCWVARTTVRWTDPHSALWLSERLRLLASGRTGSRDHCSR
jgi:tetraacyldisaccharide 4'-kinase